ncbi:MAG TPA: hypothetical protein VFM55_26600, partial [Micromonosporaceae bacterium]|nr:hypothetical protein [Micromonosporaceae bacterium]
MPVRERARQLGRGALAAVVAVGALSTAVAPAARASHTPQPSSVTIAGSLDTELGCAADWDPACPDAQLAYDANDDAWQRSWSLPAGAFDYKAALNGGWAENYGLGGVANGPNVPLPLDASATVKFYYDHKSHWVTSDRNAT